MNTVDNLTFQISLEQNRFILKYLSLIGIPFLGYLLFYNVMIGRLHIAGLLTFMVVLLFFNLLISQAIKNPQKEYVYHRSFCLLFFTCTAILVTLILALKSNIVFIPWFYLFITLLFPTTGYKQGALYTVCMISALGVIWNVFPESEIAARVDLQIRFIVSGLLSCVIFFMLGRHRSLQQKELILNQLTLEKTEHELLKAFDQLKQENEQRKQAERELITYKEHLEQLVDERTGELEESNCQLQEEVEERREIQFEQQRLISIVEHSSDFIGFTSLEWNIVFLNSAGKQLIGIDPLAIDSGLQGTSRSIKDYLHPELSNGPMFREIQQKGYWQGQSYFRNVRSGSWVPMDITFFQILHPVSKQPTGYATVSRDISQKLKEEEQREILEKQLRQSQKVEAIGTLTGGIAHDFNNILGTITGFSEFLLDSLPQENEEYEYAKEIYQAGERASNLVAQLLTFSRTEETNLKPLKIARLLKEVIRMFRATTPSTIEINSIIESDENYAVFANETQIHQVIVNLCTNAAYAIGSGGGTIDVRTQSINDPKSIKLSEIDSDGPLLEVSVSDTGSGIPSEIRDRIFDPFFTTKGVNEGTGLGLSIVHGIMKSHNGAIKVESEVGQGTTFYLYLPIRNLQYTVSAPVKEVQYTGHEHILVVEDEVKLGYFYKKFLSRLGYKITLADNGAEALEIFKHQPESFDLIFTDQTMPKITGFELSQQILEMRPNMPIILSTGYDAYLSEETVLAAGITCFLMKPVKIAKLSGILREILDNRPT